MEADVVQLIIFSTKKSLNAALVPLQMSHLRELVTEGTSPLACSGVHNTAAAADSRLALLTEIAPVEDQAQSLEAASALSGSQIMWADETLLFDLQQLILQPPAGQKHKNVTGH